MRNYRDLALTALATLTLACGEGAMPGDPEIAADSQELTTLASLTQLSYRAPSALASSNGNLYWTANVIDEFGPDVSAVYRAGKDSAPGAEAALYEERGDSGGYRQFGALVYANPGAFYGYFLAHYEDFGAGTRTSYIKRVPLTGGPAVVLGASPAYAAGRDLETDGISLFWADEGGLRSMLLSGGAITTLVSGAGISRIALDAGYVYYGQGSQIRRVSKGGGAVSVPVIGGGTVTALHVHAVGAATTLYWGESTGAVRGKQVGGTATVVHQAPMTGRTVTSVGHDGARVLWSDCAQAGNGCRVMKLQGSSRTTIASNQVGAGHLQWDATRLFYGTSSGLYKYIH